MNPKVEITKVDNGYILKLGYTNTEVFPTLDAALTRMLLYFEGRSPTFTGESYGMAMILREPPGR